MLNKQSHKDLQQLLKDCGCSEKMTEQYLDYEKNQNTFDQIRLLDQQRTLILDRLHRAQEQIDCIDYALFELEQKK